MERPPLLSTIALLVDFPEHGLTRGEMGAVVEHLGAEGDEAVLVEFVDRDGQTYALVDVLPDQVIVLHNRRCAA